MKNALKINTKGILVLFLFIQCGVLLSQHYRGLHVLNDQIAFLSGSKGTVLKTLNGGKTWDTISPQGFEKLDFRDIYAFDKKNILILASGKGGYILKTTNGGKKWKLVFSDTNSYVFLDGFDFHKSYGIAVGDPVFQTPYNSTDTGREFIMIHSYDAGSTWLMHKFIPCMMCNPIVNEFCAAENEALFAASGTSVSNFQGKLSLVTGGNQQPHFMTGLYYDKKRIISPLPVAAGYASGAYSFCPTTNGNWVVVGGNYTKPAARDSVAAYTDNKGVTWKLSSSQPSGYRSCVAFHAKRHLLLCTGTNGSDWSKDLGQTWHTSELLKSGYNACAFSENFIWFAGNKGSWQRIAITDLKLN